MYPWQQTLMLVFIILALGAVNSYAALPPRYLSVPRFQSCLGVEKKSTWTAYCLPQFRPTACPEASWTLLSQDHTLNRCKK